MRQDTPPPPPTTETEASLKIRTLGQ
jgi:hypothetical protein